jgi:asparagine synthase (glutamine-hydrolysing)
MCGIIFLCGPKADTRLPDCLRRLRHRGPDDQRSYRSDDWALGFARLAINGAHDDGQQPLRHAGSVGAVNGEVYNHRELRQEYDLPHSECDCHVILPLLAQLGPSVIDVLDGFYAGVTIREGERRLLCLRDHIGKKPLFHGRSGTEFFVTSELKAVGNVDRFAELPLGACEVDLETGEVRQLAAHGPHSTGGSLSELFAAAVLKRTPAPEQPMGVFLSGGLDSSLVAAHVAAIRQDATYLTLGAPESPDQKVVHLVASSLGLTDVHHVALPTAARLPELIRAVVRATESFNPSIVSNGVATYLLAEAARTLGLKVVLTGEGADELFGGYHQFNHDDGEWAAVREALIRDMRFTELRRLDLSCMAHSVEARCPFLDRSVRALSDRLRFEDLYGAEGNKLALRRCFDGMLPPAILWRPKTSCDVGSGIRGLIVRHLRRHGRSERAALRDVWREVLGHDDSHPHFSAYPMFDQAIDRRGVTHR